MPKAQSGIVLLFAGLAILAAGVLHAVVNVPHLRQDLVEINVRPTLVAAVVSGLSFGALGLLVAIGAANLP